jgi:hypothetical protein
VVRWLKLGDAVQVFDFPHDPALDSLGPLLASGRFTLAGHRLGKRAALRELASDRFLFLRPEGVAGKSFAKVEDAWQRLTRAGLAGSRPLALADDARGWWAEAVPGTTLDPATASVATWEELGETLARAHAPHAGEPARADSLAAAIHAGRKQLALLRMADPALADELEHELDAVAVSAASMTAGRPAWIHGDLHPLQVLVGPRLVVLDWERARIGEGEEDLGNFHAHLAWEAFEAAPAAWSALLRGYARAGGAYDPARVAAHARAALARVRVVHGWRDSGRALARDAARWQAWRDGLAR